MAFIPWITKEGILKNILNKNNMTVPVLIYFNYIENSFQDVI